jgi:hypothetical protein
VSNPPKEGRHVKTTTQKDEKERFRQIQVEARLRTKKLLEGLRKLPAIPETADIASEPEKTVETVKILTQDELRDVMYEEFPQFKEYAKGVDIVASRLVKLYLSDDIDDAWLVDPFTDFLIKYFEYLMPNQEWKVYMKQKHYHQYSLEFEYIVLYGMVQASKVDLPGHTTDQDWIQMLKRVQREHKLIPQPPAPAPPTSLSDVDVFAIENWKGGYRYEEFREYKNAIHNLAKVMLEHHEDASYFHKDDYTPDERSFYHDLIYNFEGMSKSNQQYSPVNQWELCVMDFIIDRNNRFHDKDENLGFLKRWSADSDGKGRSRMATMPASDMITALDEDLYDAGRRPFEFGRTNDDDMDDDQSAPSTPTTPTTPTTPKTPRTRKPPNKSVKKAEIPADRKLSNHEKEMKKNTQRRLQRTREKMDELRKVKEKVEKMKQIASKRPLSPEGAEESPDPKRRPVETQAAGTEPQQSEPEQPSEPERLPEPEQRKLLYEPEKIKQRWGVYSPQITTLARYIRLLIDETGFAKDAIQPLLNENPITFAVYRYFEDCLDDQQLYDEIISKYDSKSIQDEALIVECMDGDVEAIENDDEDKDQCISLEKWQEFLGKIPPDMEETEKLIELRLQSELHTFPADASRELTLENLTKRLEALQDW